VTFEVNLSVPVHHRHSVLNRVLDGKQALAMQLNPTQSLRKPINFANPYFLNLICMVEGRRSAKQKMEDSKC